ncbi:MAG: hypothetical protein FWH22_11410, partial [Fibromonadales bacterium]|nr:hypothetical protein [Fibromonadales bacterium]
MEPAPRNAAIIRNGFAPQNPAASAFENRTKFGTSIQFESADAQKDNDAIPLSSFTVPSVSMILPLGVLGVFSIGLEQKYFSNNRLELLDTTLNSNIRLVSRTGVYEFLPSYSIRLPSFLSNFAVGASYRILFGNSYSTLERGHLDWGDEAWMARNVMITKRERAHFEADSDWWQNFGYSLHFHKRTIDYFISYFPSIQVKKDIRENVQTRENPLSSNFDTLQTNRRIESFKLPKRFASGVHFRFLQNKNLSFVYEHQNFEESGLAIETENVETGKSVSYFAEYKINGTGLHYSPFLKRNDFGISAWYAEKYLKDVNEYGASLFSDLWLGRRGTIVGIALFGGYRQAKEPYWDEPFFGLRLNLTGVGAWGTSVRRR